METVDIKNEPWYRSPEERAEIVPYVYLTKNEKLFCFYTSLAFLGMLVSIVSMIVMILNPQLNWPVATFAIGVVFTIMNALQSETIPLP